jgi:hypothetical protein
MYKNNEIIGGWQALAIGVFIGILFSSRLAGLVFMAIALYFTYSGFNELSFGQKPFTRTHRQTGIQPANSAPVAKEPTIADKIKNIHIATDFKCPSCGSVLKPTDFKCSSCGSFLVASANLPQPSRWGDVDVGQPIRITLPTEGPLNLSVRSRVYYGELWQAQMKPNIPWTLTGNYYVSLELDAPYFLINWQERFFLITSYSPLTDYDIQTYFAPYARRFAASNQTKDVWFHYPQTSWHIDDIGKFRIEYTDGKIAKGDPGAVGRFIHASNKETVLIVEDYESGGRGQDTVWFGVKIEEKDIKL